MLIRHGKVWWLVISLKYMHFVQFNQSWTKNLSNMYVHFSIFMKIYRYEEFNIQEFVKAIGRLLIYIYVQRDD